MGQKEYEIMNIFPESSDSEIVFSGHILGDITVEIALGVWDNFDFKSCLIFMPFEKPNLRWFTSEMSEIQQALT